MWYLKLDDENLMVLLEVITSEYIGWRKIPLNDKSIEQIRGYLTRIMYDLMKDRMLYLTSPTLQDEQKEMDEVIDRYIGKWMHKQL